MSFRRVRICFCGEPPTEDKKPEIVRKIIAAHREMRLRDILDPEDMTKCEHCPQCVCFNFNVNEECPCDTPEKFKIEEVIYEI